MEEKVILKLRLSIECKKAIERIMELNNDVDMATAVRRAIGNELFFQEQKLDDWKVVIEKDGLFREVLFSK